MGNIGCKGCASRCASESCVPKGEDGAHVVSPVSTDAECELDKAFINDKEQSAPQLEASPGPESARPPLAVEGPSAAKIPKPGEEYVITLDKTANSMLGLDVDCVTESQALPIRAINGGLAAVWNEQNQDVQILIGDKIVAVNGERADTSTMMTKCARENLLKLVLKRGSAGVHDADCVQRVE